MTKKILLKVSIGLKGDFPTIILQDDNQNILFGNCIYHSVESLARLYQKDNEYNSKDKFDYYMIWENGDKEIKLFVKSIMQGYDEDNIEVDETNKN